LSVERAAFALVAAFLDPLLATPLAGMIASYQSEWCALKIFTFYLTARRIDLLSKIDPARI
jgi:hypothetical protein